ncbi:MAG: glycosyltransferase [bacterium]
MRSCHPDEQPAAGSSPIRSLSVVIACRNAEPTIAACVEALLNQRPGAARCEIVVVDNGSTDRSCEILSRFRESVRLLPFAGRNISAARNHGVAHSTGEWLAFVDADVEVDRGWLNQIERAVSRFRERYGDASRVVTGSTYRIPAHPTWVERVWFGQLKARDRGRTTYINGGNLILSRSLFEEVGGFDPGCTTGEDTKLCEEARACGAKIVKDDRIRTVHHGYPKNVSSFFKRERWHGLGMVRAFRRPWRSRDLCLAVYDVAGVAFALVLLLVTWNVLLALLLMVALPVIPALLMALRRGRGKMRETLLLAWLYCVYSAARVLSLVDLVRAGRGGGAHQRSRAQSAEAAGFPRLPRTRSGVRGNEG